MNVAHELISLHILLPQKILITSYHICVCMKHSLKQTLLGSGALASLLLSASLVSCQDEDYGYTSAEVRAAAYDRNFIKKYGEIDPEQSWDLTKYAFDADPELSTRAAIEECPLGAQGSNTGWGDENASVTTTNELFYVNTTLVEKFTSTLKEGPEGKDNYKLGKTGFELFSNGVFYIIPMFQGQSGVNTDLHMVVTYGGQEYDHAIWQRSVNIEQQLYGQFDWKSLTNGRSSFPTIDWYVDTNNGKFLACTNEAKGIRSRPIKCLIPKGAKIDFYLHTINGHLNLRDANSPAEHKDYDRIDSWGENSSNGEANLARTGDKMWASHNKMIQLDSESLVGGFKIAPEEIARYGKEYMFIACEDAWSKNEESAPTYTYTTDRTKVNGRNLNDNQKQITVDRSDWQGDNDLNDLVFLFVADELPTVAEANTVSKRYIIEDLGSIVDWDFNDVVVDLIQTQNPTTNEITQRAELKHLCGTTPFELYIGEPNNTDNSVKLNFQASKYAYTDYLGNRQTFSISNGKIPGQQMAQSEEITDIKFDLPASNPWKPSENNIWVKVYKDQTYKDNYRPNNGTDIAYRDPNNDNYGGELDQDYSHGNGNNGNGVVDGEIDDDFDQTTFETVAFPRKGKVPRIIAVDLDYQWTEEDHDIQKSMWASYNITATTVSADDSGGVGTVSGTGRYKNGRPVSLTATPNTGNIFVEWSDGVKDRNRKFVASGDASFTAKFKNVSNPHGFEYIQNNEGAWTNFDFTKDQIKQLFDDGYNTIIVEATGNNGSFGLKAADKSHDYILNGDASDYQIVNGEGSVVLTESQIEAIKAACNSNVQYPLTLQLRNSGTTITKISFAHTQDFFTVELMDVEHGGIKASDTDRHSGFWTNNSDPTGSNTPWILNGHRDFIKASYAARTENNPTAPGATLNVVDIEEGYYFKHWEQYVGNSLKNIDTNNPLTVYSDVKLKAVIVKPHVKVSHKTTKESVSYSLSYTSDQSSIANNQSAWEGDVNASKEFKVKATYDLQGIQVQNNVRFLWNDSNIENNEHINETERTFTLNNSDLDLTSRIEYKIISVVKDQNNNFNNNYGGILYKVKKDTEQYNAPYIEGDFWAERDQVYVLYPKPKPRYKFVSWGAASNDVKRELTITGDNSPNIVYRQVQNSEITRLYTNNDGYGLRNNYEFKVFDPNENGNIHNDLTNKLGENSRVLVFEFANNLPSGAKFAFNLGGSDNKKGWSLKDTNVEIVGNILYYELDYYDWENVRTNGFILKPSNLGNNVEIKLKYVSIY